MEFFVSLSLCFNLKDLKILHILHIFENSTGHCARYERLQTILISWGFTNSKSDTSLFVFQSGNTLIYFFVYVDDIHATGNDPNFLDHLITQLNSIFAQKDFGPIHYFLRTEAHRSSYGLHLC